MAGVCGTLRNVPVPTTSSFAWHAAAAVVVVDDFRLVIFGLDGESYYLRVFEPSPVWWP
jgi:hypothetical protein